VLQAVTTGVPRNRNGAASFVVILSKPEKQDAVRRRARERRRTALFAADSGISGRRGSQLQRPSRGKKSRNWRRSWGRGPASCANRQSSRRELSAHCSGRKQVRKLIQFSRVCYQ